MSREWVKNENGVEGYWSHCGTMFGRKITDIDGRSRFKTAIPLFVPRVCTTCPLFEYGEYGDYGNLLSGPLCEAYVWFPTRSGTCKRKDREVSA